MSPEQFKLSPQSSSFAPIGVLKIAGFTRVEVHLVTVDFLKRMAELMVGPLNALLPVAVVPEKVFIRIGVTGGFTIVIVGALPELVVGAVAPVRRMLVIAGVTRGVAIVAGVIVGVLVEVVPVAAGFVVTGAEVVPVVMSEGEIIVGVLTLFRVSAYTENVRNTPQKPTKTSNFFAKECENLEVFIAKRREIRMFR